METQKYNNTPDSQPSIIITVNMEDQRLRNNPDHNESDLTTQDLYPGQGKVKTDIQYYGKDV